MLAFSSDDLNLTRAFFEMDFADDAKCGEIFKAELLDSRSIITITANSNGGFLIAADGLVLAQRLKCFKHLVSKKHKLLPFWVFRCWVCFGQQGQVDAFDILGFVRDSGPAFLGGVDEDGS